MTDIMLFSGRHDYESLNGQIFYQLPIPSDIHVGVEEYGALLMAIENRAEKDKITILEAGAAWGPWISAGAIVAKRLGIKNINLIGVEAEPRKFDYMHRHLQNNGITQDEFTNITLECGAVWTSDTKVNFGSCENFTDYAAAATDETSEKDYIGRDVDFAEVQGFTLSTLLKDHETVDYIAMDIQGSEYDVLSSSIDVLNSKVRFLSVGTHSPAIHGNIIELFFKNKWHLVWDFYPHYQYDLNTPTLAGMTTIDGELVLVNSNLVEG